MNRTRDAELPLGKGGVFPSRRGGYQPPACRTWAQIGDPPPSCDSCDSCDGFSPVASCRKPSRRIRNSEFGIRNLRKMFVRSVGAGALDGPLVGHGRGSAERSGDRSLRSRRAFPRFTRLAFQSVAEGDTTIIHYSFFIFHSPSSPVSSNSSLKTQISKLQKNTGLWEKIPQAGAFYIGLIPPCSCRSSPG